MVRCSKTWYHVKFSISMIVETRMPKFSDVLQDLKKFFLSLKIKSTWEFLISTAERQNVVFRRPAEKRRISPGGSRTTHLAAQRENEGPRAYFFLEIL